MKNFLQRTKFKNVATITNPFSNLIFPASTQTTPSPLNSLGLSPNGSSNELQGNKHLLIGDNSHSLLVSNLDTKLDSVIQSNSSTSSYQSYFQENNKTNNKERQGGLPLGSYLYRYPQTIRMKTGLYSGSQLYGLAYRVQSFSTKNTGNNDKANSHHTEKHHKGHEGTSHHEVNNHRNHSNDHSKHTNTHKSHVSQRKDRIENARENKVPASSISRAFGFAGLGVSLAANAVGTSLKSAFVTIRVSSEKKSLYDTLGSDQVAEKLTQTLCRMRGVPLKLGQALSMQEEQLVPKAIREAMARAQKSADIMPQSQMNKMIEKELGKNWRDYFEHFEDKPTAAASIGQVHRGRTKEGMDVAVKVQYPGVVDSIDSDVNNLNMIFNYTNVLPKALFIGDLLTNIRNELKEECNYISEAKNQMEFRGIFKDHPNFYVPQVVKHLSTKHVLTTEWIEGLSIEDCIQTLNQDMRDRVGELIITLTFSQLFEHRYMQTDPNPANYFYAPNKDILHLLDFGSVKRYSKEFVLNYMDMLAGSLARDRSLIIDASQRLGILTGEENRELKETHITAIILVGEPFNQEKFDFGNQTLTKRIYEKIPDLLSKRLKAPPQEVFALHRLLGGAFLMCTRLQCVVGVKKIFEEYYNKARSELKN